MELFKLLLRSGDIPNNLFVYQIMWTVIFAHLAVGITIIDALIKLI